MNIFGPQEISEVECITIAKALERKTVEFRKAKYRRQIDYQDITQWPICLYRQGDKYYLAVHKIGHCPWDKEL